jgi:gamma-glutamyltranspeptidase/glutathione hydrolase
MSKNKKNSTGCVAAGTPEAARAGVRILEEGGNAVDAAVAVSLVLGVTEPSGSGIGGQSTFIVHPQGGEPFVLNGTSFSPQHTPADAALSDLNDHRASTIPSNLKVLDLAFRKHGSGRMSWERLVEPAINYALEGYLLGPFRRRALLRHEGCIRKNPVIAKLLLAPDGTTPPEGTRMLSRQLGKTLRRIARHGAEDFYTGEIAREIAGDMSANGGWITEKDLGRLPEPETLAPIRGTYREFEVLTLPPPGAGWVVLLALNVLEQAPEDTLSREDAGRAVWLAEALRIAQRHRSFRPIPNPVEYEEAVARKINKEKARRIVRSMIRAGSGETTHFCVVDPAGTVVGVTQSLNSYFGAKTADDKLGFLYNDYMREFIAGVERHPYSLRSFAMPYSFMSATVLSFGGEPKLVLGSPGDDRILSAVVQVISHWVDVDRGIRAAVRAPRLHTLRHDELLLEKRPCDENVLLALEEAGYTVHLPLSSLFAGSLNPYFGGVHALAKEKGGWCGAADPRRDGAVEYANANSKSSKNGT